MKHIYNRIKHVLLPLFLLLVFEPAHGAGGHTVSLNWLSRYHGLNAPETHDEKIILKKGAGKLYFFNNSRIMEFNDTLIWLGEPVRTKWGRPRILKTEAEKTIIPLLYPGRVLARKSRAVVLLDPGHGGRDNGVVDPLHGQKEKDITLRLALKAAALLENELIVVRFTRSADDWMGLGERSALAADYNADLFVSIHLNGAVNSAASGIETHVMPPAGHPITAMPAPTIEDRLAHPGNNHDAANIILGHALQSSLLKHTGGLDRGVRRSRFNVLRNAPCPAVLVECGFLTNPEEAEKFLDADSRNVIARAIAEGILTYLNIAMNGKLLN